MNHSAGLLRVVTGLAPLVLLVAACGEATAPPPAIAAVTIVPETVEVVVQGTVQLTAAMWDVSGRAVRGRAMTWASSNPAVVSVSTTGLVTDVVVVAWATMVVRTVVTRWAAGEFDADVVAVEVETHLVEVIMVESWQG